jgi:nitronate monooxygenase
MGAGVSGPRLTRAVWRNGGLGVLSSAGLKDFYTITKGRSYTTYEAVQEEIATAMTDGYGVGLNVMGILAESYDETVTAALDAKVSVIFFGAGVPKRGTIFKDTAFGLITSSARGLKIMLRYCHQKPDVIILEGPNAAGGHLGARLEDIGQSELELEELLPEVLEVATKNGNIPVIVAGGIYTNTDIWKFRGLGASGVQLGTRFLATEESSATAEFKRAVVECRQEDIITVGSSPCGFPFRILKCSPAYLELLAGTRRPKCRMGYVLGKDKEGHYTICKAHPNHPEHSKYFCICDALRAAIGLAPGEPAMYTVGTNAYRVDKILPVSELMIELAHN